MSSVALEVKWSFPLERGFLKESGDEMGIAQSAPTLN